MSHDDAPLKGPDLSAGVPIAEIPLGGMLLGHADGEQVLLTRQGDEVHAVSAGCTHYGGPLAEGVLEDGVVRCPWHHACFSVRTGEALRAPALSPLACWRVERSGDRVVVREKVERDALASTYPAHAPATGAERRMVIVGGGAAGAAAAEMLRRCGFGGSVTIVDEELDSPYDRPNLSKDFLAGTAPAEWIPLRPAGFYEAHRVTLVRGRATSLDTAGRTLAVEGHGTLPFDALLLATGAEPVHLPLSGADLSHVHYLRSLEDSRRIAGASVGASRAVVIGGSFIGLEVAASLRARGLAVRVVAPEALPLERVLGRELGTFIKSLHEEKGVEFHLERKPALIGEHSVELDDGTRLDADLVVIGVGVRPRLALAEQAGLAMDRGVLVNEQLETSAPGVWAAGDIARWPDPHSGEQIRVEHWVVAQRMGQCAARNMLGGRERFREVPFFWSAHYDVSVAYVGHAESWDAVRVDGSAEGRDVAVRYEREGKLLALATIGRDVESLREEMAMERRGAAEEG